MWYHADWYRCHLSQQSNTMWLRSCRPHDFVNDVALWPITLPITDMSKYSDKSNQPGVCFSVCVAVLTTIHCMCAINTLQDGLCSWSLIFYKTELHTPMWHMDWIYVFPSILLIVAGLLRHTRGKSGKTLIYIPIWCGVSSWVTVWNIMNRTSLTVMLTSSQIWWWMSICAHFWHQSLRLWFPSPPSLLRCS